MIGRVVDRLVHRDGSVALERLGSLVVGGVHMHCPFMTASGTSGHDVELGAYMPLERLGAVVVKSLFHEPWPGNPAPRVHLAGTGMINAVGLQGPGVDGWIAHSLPLLRASGANVVVSLWGRNVDEYARAAVRLADVAGSVSAIEVNLSCPNLEGRAGIIAHDAELSGRIVKAVREAAGRPTWAKLSPNTDRIVEVASTVTDAGASALVLVNTVLGMQIDIGTGRPSLGNGGGGLSGPPIHAVAVRSIFDVRAALPGIDIIGVGGVSSGADAVEMMMAGARAIQVGTASFAEPAATWRIAREAARLVVGGGSSRWADVVGRAQVR